MAERRSRHARSRVLERKRQRKAKVRKLLAKLANAPESERERIIEKIRRVSPTYPLERVVR